MDREKILSSFIENEAALKKRNDAGIEKYRKGDFTLRLPKEVAGLPVHIRQTKHAFLFGTTAFMLGCFEKPEKEAIYRERFTQLFNQAVVPFYWSDLEPQEGALRFRTDSPYIYRRPAPDTVLEFCRETGIEPKGHCLVWNGFVPEWLKRYTPEERKGVLERRFREIAEEYADKIPSFDIVNESASNYRHGEKALFPGYDEYGLRLGAKYFPNNRKILNETNEAIWRDYRTEGKYMAFRMQLDEFLRNGVPFDEIGLQFHIFETVENLTRWDVHDSYLNAASMVEVLDIFDRYDLPMHISEITIPSSGHTKESEDLQAYLTEALYRTWFATRSMKSIVWWNMVDGYAAYAPIGSDEGENRFGGGLLRFDMTPKPAYEALDRLINHEWKTETDATADASGVLSFRGFYGSYDVTVGNKTYPVCFEKDGDTVTLA